MRAVVQRAQNAQVVVDDRVVGNILFGLVILVGFTEGDGLEQIKKMVHKVLNLRIFPDDNGVMNRSVLDVEGKILSVSQFTLYADTKRKSPKLHQGFKWRGSKEIIRFMECGTCKRNFC